MLFKLINAKKTMQISIDAVGPRRGAMRGGGHHGGGDKSRGDERAYDEIMIVFGSR
jgi:hypothetical protein